MPRRASALACLTVAAAVGTACTASPGPSAPPGLPGPTAQGPSARAPVPSSPLPTPTSRTITVRATDTTVTPNGQRVDLARGETLVLTFENTGRTKTWEVHDHLSGAETSIAPARSATVRLTGDRTGRFEVETHHPDIVVLVVSVR